MIDFSQRHSYCKQMNPTHIPTLELCNSYFSYDQETGEMLWRINRKKASKGSVAGHVDSDGYLVVGVNNKQYKVHRIAWLLHYGEWPQKQIDHINGIKTDNRISNLRQASPRENRRNAGPSKSNISGIRGVSWNSRLSKWKADIRTENKRIFLGYYKTVEEAKSVMIKAKAMYHGEFAGKVS